MPSPKLNSQIYTEASDWLIEFRAGDIDAAGRRRFHRWLQTSPEHMRAYLELAALWNEGAALDAQRDFDDARLLEDVRAESNVVPIPARPAEVDSPRSPVVRRWVVALAAGLLCVVSAAGYWYLPGRHLYATRLGEQRLLTLEDGSTIELNSASRVRVRFARGRRDVDLLQGQALFQVAKDQTRPFIVHADSTDVRAVGTQFDVYKQPSGTTTVTVVEGRVAVLYTPSEESVRSNGVQRRSGSDGMSPDAAPSGTPPTVPETSIQGDGSGAVLLTAGQQVAVTGTSARKTERADVAAATAWTHHELVFKGTPLRTVADEFNRYNSRQFIVRDTQLGQLKITGIFSSTDPAPLIRFLEARPDIVILQKESEILVSHKP